MDRNELEGTQDPQAKVAEPTQEKEVEKQTEPQEQSTVGKTYTQEDFDKAVGKSTASLQQQISLTKQQLKAIEVERNSHKSSLGKMDEDIKFLENKLLTVASDKFGGDEEAIAGFKNSLALELERRKFLREKEAFEKQREERDVVAYAQMLEKKALDLQKKYQVPSDLLEMCTTEEQMDKLAQAFPEVSSSQPAEKEEEPSKFDSGITGGGASLAGLSAEERLARALSKMDKGK